MPIKDFSCFSSGGHFVQRKKTFKKCCLKVIQGTFHEIIFKMGNWPTKRCCLMLYLFFSSGGHFVQWR